MERPRNQASVAFSVVRVREGQATRPTKHEEMQLRRDGTP